MNKACVYFIVMQCLDVAPERSPGAGSTHSGNPGWTITSVAVLTRETGFFEFFPGGQAYLFHADLGFFAYLYGEMLNALHHRVLGLFNRLPYRDDVSRLFHV